MEKINHDALNQNVVLVRPVLTALRIAIVLGGLVTAFWLLFDYVLGTNSVATRIDFIGFTKINLPFVLPRAFDGVFVLVLAYVLFRMIPAKCLTKNFAALLGASFGLAVGSISLALGLIATNGKMSFGYLLLVLLVVSLIAFGKAMLIGLQFQLSAIRVLVSYWLHLILALSVGFTAVAGIEYGWLPTLLFLVVCALAGNPIRRVNEEPPQEEIDVIEEWAYGMGDTKRSSNVDPNYDRRENFSATREYDASVRRSEGDKGVFAI